MAERIHPGDRQRAVPPRLRLARRMGRALMVYVVLASAGLAIGMAGYAWTEGMSPVDAFVNAAMILSGMGPVGELKTSGGKLFAGFYALFSGLFVVVATGFVLAPILHHVLHSFHIEQGKHEND